MTSKMAIIQDEELDWQLPQLLELLVQNRQRQHKEKGWRNVRRMRASSIESMGWWAIFTSGATLRFVAVKQGQSSRSQGSQLGALLSLSGLSKKTIVLVGSTITNSTGLMTNLLTVSNFQGTFVFFFGGGNIQGCRFVPFRKQSHRQYLQIKILVSWVWLWFRAEFWYARLA